MSCEPTGEQAGGGEVEHGGAAGVRVSTSLASRRVRPNQANERSTIQRRGMTTKPAAWSERLTMATEPLLACRRGGHLALVAAVGEQQAEPGKRRRMRASKQGEAIAVLDAGGMDDRTQQEGQRRG